MAVSLVPSFALAGGVEEGDAELPAAVDETGAGEEQAAAAEETDKTAEDDPAEGDPAEGEDGEKPALSAEETAEEADTGEEKETSEKAEKKEEKETSEEAEKEEEKETPEEADKEKESAEESEDGEEEISEEEKAAKLAPPTRDISTITIYFGVPSHWEGNFDQIKFNAKNSKDSNNWTIRYMEYDWAYFEGKRVYKVVLDKDSECPENGFGKLQFQRFLNGEWKEQQEPISSWTAEDVFSGKIWVNGQWKDFDPGSLKTVYYDATYSKLQVYKNDIDNDNAHFPAMTQVDYLSIPAWGTRNVYFIATGDGMPTISGQMLDASNSTYTDVYKISFQSGYTNVVYSSFMPDDLNSYTSWETQVSDHGGQTRTLEIPSGDKCFYGNTHDPVIYYGGGRDGYWGDPYHTRDAGEPNVVYGGSMPTDSGIYYINATIYDYYSDFELNKYGNLTNNRSRYPSSISDSKYHHWVTFRQFDQALSDAYTGTGSIPLYTGQFQPDITNWGYHYKDIAGILNLYGYNSSNEAPFMSTNNSAMDVNGDYSLDGNNNSNKVACAAKGLVSDMLSGGNIMTSNGSMVLPYFNANFLNGGNSKHAVIGAVYEDVAFPFTKKNIEGVDYWQFNSNETTLSLHNDGSRSYLKNVGNADWSRNTQASGEWAANRNYGFFPFNEALGGSPNASKYNFGFGVKMEIKFILPADGTVNGNDIKLNFKGDDDLWVFIDNKLILDVGGDHAPATGEINFRSKTATVSAVKASQGDDSPSTTTSFTLEGDSGTEHTMTIFYMERGMWESNLSLSFNFVDDNQFSVSKTVDTSDVNRALFPDELFTDHPFTFEAKNLATHYGPYSTTVVQTAQDGIRDYGSATSGALEPAAGAVYAVGSTSSSVGTDGTFSLKTGETAVFSNQFRRGSYIALREVLSTAEAALFDTSWTMKDVNGAAVTSFAAGDHVTNPGSLPSNWNGSGTAIDDGRIEKIFDIDTRDASSANKYKSDNTPYHPSGSFLFRSYSNPDATVGETELTAAFTNKVNVGSLTIEKAQAANSAPLTGTYTFTVTFTNIGGLDLNNDNATPITKTLTLDAGGSETITGIPVGTQYVITETAPSDGSVLFAVDGDKTLTSASGTIRDGVTDTHTFTNTKKPTVSVSVTKEWRDNEAPVSSVTVALQRSTDGTTWDTVTDYAAVELNESNSWSASFSGLDKFDDYTADSPQAYTYRFVENGDSGSDHSVYLGGLRFIVSYRYNNDTDSFATTVTNTYTPPVYSLTVSKTVSGNMANRFKAFRFTLTLTDYAGHAIASKTFACEGAQTSITTGTDGKASFTLKHGQSLTIKGIPEGAHYTVEEEDMSAQGYTTTVDSSDGRTASGTLTADASHSFTNRRDVAIPTGVALDPRVGLLMILGSAVLGMSAIALRRKARRDEKG